MCSLFNPSKFTRELTSDDIPWVKHFMKKHWSAETVVTLGRIHHPHVLPGYVLDYENKHLGLITYEIRNNQCEIVTLDSFRENTGIGSALIKLVHRKAVSLDCSRLWLITTNDNTHAIRFYQKRGFVIAACHVNSLENARQLKPEIPLTGMDLIPLRDEIEFEIILQ